MPITEIIKKLITEGANVIDFGCGDGSLLCDLKDSKNINGYGIEIDPDQIELCIENGVSVIEQDIDQGIQDFSSFNFDIAIMASSIQCLKNPDIALDKIDERDQRIDQLNFTIDSLKLAVSSKNDSRYNFDFINLAKDAKIQFSELESFSFAKMLRSSNFRTADTVLVAKVRWNSVVADSLRIQRSSALKAWLEQELQEQNVEVLTQ